MPPVLLSGREQWKFIPQSQGAHDIGSVEVYDAAAIIDGQHRIGGYVRLFELRGDARPIDFILIPELDLEEEIREFVTINNTQKGVPKALTSFLGISTGDKASDEAEIAWGLNQRDDSPFKDKITRQKLQQQHLFALHSVAKNVGRTFNHGAFEETFPDNKLDIIIQYWRTIADFHPAEWEDIEKEKRTEFEYKLLELTGFIAWSLVGPQILGASFDAETQSMNWDKVESLFEKVRGRIDWAKDGQYLGRTGEVGGEAIRREIERCISGQ